MKHCYQIRKPENVIGEETPFQNLLNLFYVDSLEGRFEDEELQHILEDIQTKRSFQY